MKTNIDKTFPLQASNLSIGYPQKGKDSRAVASNLNLNLNQGEFVCLLGPNGVGKSTLIRALAGMDKPLEGNIQIEGSDIRDLTPKERARHISVVLTESLPVGMFSADAIVALGRHPHTNWTGSLSEHDRKRITEALQAVEGEALATRQVSELSDGERQKIMVARALAQEASIMLLDEPTAFLDLPRRVELMLTLRDLTRQKGLSILLSTHDLDLALRCADKLWLFGENNNVIEGIPESLALDGSIAAVFASESLDWDPEHGSFRMHRNPCASVWIEGEGTELAWTRRALARIGYGLSDSQETSRFIVKILKSPENLEWLVIDRDLSHRFRSIESLVTWMQNPNNGEANHLDPHYSPSK